MANRLLVVEDSVTIRKLVEIALKASGVEIEFALSGGEAIERARTFVPDVVLMDYVLPDMKGVDICARLAEFGGAKPVVMVMSAKMEEVRHLFAPFSFVTDFIAKPFKAPDVAQRVMAAIKKGTLVIPVMTNVAPDLRSLPPSAPRSIPPRGDAESKEREAAAAALFGLLRTKLAQIPTFMGELGDAPAARFFARKLLTAEVVDRVIESLLPILHDRVRRTFPGSEGGPVDGDVLLEGRLGTLSPYDLLAFIGRAERSGELVVGEQPHVVGYFRDGRLLLASTRDAVEWGRDLRLDLASVPPEIRKRAEEEQAASAKPVLVSLAEVGSLPPCDLSGLLHDQGKRLLRSVMGSLPPGTPFRFRVRANLPLYVDAYGRALSFRQIMLERLREDPRTTEGLPRTSPAAVFERRLGFSKRIVQFELTPAERRVLALVDGASTVRAIAERTDLPTEVAAATLRRLESVELLVVRDVVKRVSELPRPPQQERRVMVLDHDADGFQAPLRRLLADRVDPYELLPLDGEKDVFTAIRRVRPALVILNVEDHGTEEAQRTARALRGAEELRDLLLVAVQEIPSREDAETLAEAGFDAVLSKPVSYPDIERLVFA